MTDQPTPEDMARDLEALRRFADDSRERGHHMLIVRLTVLDHLLAEVARLRAILDAPRKALFADGREPTENERHLLNLLSWRQKEAADALAEVARLRPYEQAIASMAAQYLCPPTTAEQLCQEILRGKEPS